MRFFKYIFVLSLFSISVFSQTNSKFSSVENSQVFAIRKTRSAKIKADVLQEIKVLNRKDQVYCYAQLGNIYWERDKKEAISWLSEAVEIGTSPLTKYRNNEDKLSILWSLLNAVFGKDVALSNKVISKIKEIKIDESDLKNLKDANKIYLAIAQKLLSQKGNEGLAFEFAVLSLRGEKPAIDQRSSDFFGELSRKDENLSDQYFTRLLESVKKNNQSELILALLYLFDKKSSRFNQFSLSESQKRDLLGITLPIIQQQSEQLTLKKINDCYLTKRWGLKYLEDYKRLLPEQLPIIENAISVCQNADIEYWKKPDFPKKPLRTAQDYLNTAKEINDPKTKTNYLTLAAQTARYENNYRLSLEILDHIDRELRDSFWVWSKIESSSKLIEEYFKIDDLAGISMILVNAPEEFRPFIIIKSLNSISQLKPNQKDFILSLMNQARAEFNGIEHFSTDFTLNPTQFAELTRFYVKFKLYEQAIATHEESIKSFNRVVKTLPVEYKEKNIIPRTTSFGRFSNQYPNNDTDFINQYFDRIYINLGKIENSRVRVSERLALLEKNMEKVQNEQLVPGIPNSIK